LNQTGNVSKDSSSTLGQLSLSSLRKLADDDTKINPRNITGHSQERKFIPEVLSLFGDLQYYDRELVTILASIHQEALTTKHSEINKWLKQHSEVLWQLRIAEECLDGIQLCLASQEFKSVLMSKMNLLIHCLFGSNIPAEFLKPTREDNLLKLLEDGYPNVSDLDISEEKYPKGLIPRLRVLCHECNIKTNCEFDQIEYFQPVPVGTRKLQHTSVILAAGVEESYPNPDWLPEFLSPPKRALALMVKNHHNFLKSEMDQHLGFWKRRESYPELSVPNIQI